MRGERGEKPHEVHRMGLGEGQPSLLKKPPDKPLVNRSAESFEAHGWGGGDPHTALYPPRHRETVW